MEPDLEGKVCVVTGASSGIGRRTALDLAASGATLCVVARRRPLLESLVEELGGAARGHSLKRCDVSSRDEVRALAEHVATTHGRCDVLVNNAGHGASTRFDAEHGIDAVTGVMATNFFGAVYCTGELLGLLERAAPSHVVNVASIAGRIAVPGAAPYCASKFALVGWSEALHFELAERGVHVTLIEPGLVATEGFPKHDWAAHPLLRHALGSVEDVSRAIRESPATPKLQRRVPRWYYVFELARVLAPPLFRFGQRRFAPARR